MNAFKLLSQVSQKLSTYFSKNGYIVETTGPDTIVRDSFGYRWKVSLELLSRIDSKDFDETPYLDTNLNSIAKVKTTKT